jgi:hypothetical protein
VGDGIKSKKDKVLSSSCDDPDILRKTHKIIDQDSPFDKESSL